MGTLVSCLLVIVAALLATSVMVFFLEIVAAIALPRCQRPTLPNHGDRRPIAVLVPAHNEGSGLPSTLANIQSQSLVGDRLLVVADNCSDDTAAVARARGAEVVERNDPTKLGKGFALDCGVRHLSSNPPEIIIIVDADCRLADDANSLVTRADGQNTGGCPATVRSRPSFKSSTICPLARSAERITSQGNAMPVPISWQGKLSARSPSGRSQFFTRQENSAT